MDTSIILPILVCFVDHVTAIDDLSFYRHKYPVGSSRQKLSMETVSVLEGMLCAPNHPKKDLLQPNQIFILCIAYVALSAFVVLALVKVMKDSESDCNYKTVALGEDMAKCCRNVLPLYFYTDYIGSQMLEVMAYPVYNGASKLMSVFGNTDDGLSEKQFVQNLMSLPAEEREARMKSEAERLKTYGRSLWPIRDIMSPEELAAAGFYYTGIGTRVQCTFCHNEFSNWEPDDNPRVEHRQQYPNCPFFLKRRSGNVPLVNERSDWHHQFSMSTLSGRALSSNAAASTSASESPALVGVSSSVQPSVTVSSAQSAVPATAPLHPLWELVKTGLQHLSTDERASEENRQMHKHLQCWQCHSRQSTLLLIPCCCRSLCSQCRPTVDACPKCETSIQEAIPAILVA